MADNYLENKMEEHRRSQARPAAKSAVRRAGVLAPGLHLYYPPMWILLLSRTAAEAAPYAEALRGAGLSVALCCREGGREAAVLAQKYGARLYPDTCDTGRMLADLEKNGNRPSRIIDLGTDCGCAAICPSAAAEATPSAILARELLFLLHPEHEKLLESQTLFDLRG